MTEADKKSAETKIVSARRTLQRGTFVIMGIPTLGAFANCCFERCYRCFCAVVSTAVRSVYDKRLFILG
ncbi:MAG: hypothetical protein ACXV5N_02385 [Halobacteriota archaeon]